MTERMATRPEGRRVAIEDLRRAELVTAALRTISSQGFDKTTIRDIARAAGASTGSVHYYFETKEALLLAAVAESDAVFRQRARAEVAAVDGAAAKLNRLAELCYADDSGDGPDWNVFIDFWQQAARHPEFRGIFEAANTDWLELLVEIFELGVETGEFVLDRSVLDEAMTLAAMLDGLALHSRVTDHVTPEIACRLVAQYCDGLCARGYRSTTDRRRGRRTK
jgi:AcrR family transcriptional regulator